MKKIICLILAVAMICSVITIPVSAQSVRESLLKREVQYIDIISTARAGTKTPAFRDSFKKDASLMGDANSVYMKNRTDTTYHGVVNTMWLGWAYINMAPLSATNSTVHFFDLTSGGYEILETGKGTYESGIMNKYQN